MGRRAGMAGSSLMRPSTAPADGVAAALELAKGCAFNVFSLSGLAGLWWRGSRPDRGLPAPPVAGPEAGVLLVIHLLRNGPGSMPDG